MKTFLITILLLITTYISSSYADLRRNEGADVPVGTVLTFAGSACPVGTEITDGGALSRASYPKLFAVIGVTHGSGNGTTTFNKPDYRGLFLRMVDGSANRDPDKASRTAMNTGGNIGNTVGSVQQDQFKSHSHAMPTDNGTVTLQGGGTAAIPNRALGVNAATEFSGGTETRSKNAYVIYCIKY